jgi:peptidoglycan/LPS O-acetylase OafA/YrhL
MLGGGTVRDDRRRTAGLDGLRALAALSVLLYHTWLYRVGLPRGRLTATLDKVLAQTNLGLICFFVLSGYLLYRSFARAALTGERRVDVTGYAVRRVARIIPAYYACIVGCVVLYAAFGPSGLVPAGPSVALFAVFGQNYSMTTVMQIDPVTWTLCVEAAFYVLLPVVGVLAFRLGPRRVSAQIWMLVALIAVTIVWNTLVRIHGWGPLLYKALPAYLGHFALGMLVAMWAEGRRARPALRGRATAALFAAGVALVLADGAWSQLRWGWTVRYSLVHLLAALGFALMVAAVVAGRGAAIRWLSWRPLAGLGVISYGVYLWHLPLLLVVRNAGLAPTDIVPRVAVIASLSVAAATLSWRYLERPLIARAAARASLRHPPALQPARA